MSHSNGQAMTQRDVLPHEYSGLVNGAQGKSDQQRLQETFPNCPFFSAPGRPALTDDRIRNRFHRDTHMRFLFDGLGQQVARSDMAETEPRAFTIADRTFRGPTSTTLPFSIQDGEVLNPPPAIIDAGSEPDSTPGSPAKIQNDRSRVAQGTARTRSANLETGYQMGISGISAQGD